MTTSKKKLPPYLYWLSIFLIFFTIVSFILLDEWLLTSVHQIAFLNKKIVASTLNYFRYIGTNRGFSYLYIILVAFILYQWHAHKHIAYKTLFIILSLSVTIAIIFCLSTFFSRYIPQLAVLAHNHSMHLLNDPNAAFPSGHIARLISLITCLCILFPRRLISATLISITAVVLIGLGLLIDNRYFLSGASAGAIIGIVVPHYIKQLIFVQRLFQMKSRVN
ncbi:MAG: hypothetical protein CMF49_07415 [Legionellales bacterium]|nr:hypothetical protein [Legionellales bacterium]|tara:strand:- start:125 stop:787 length:663 start_codon:yes stop_codon:yes gene_type:complete